MEAQSLIASIIQWATTQPGILGVALVGSHARGTARPDSDVDLVIVATDPQPYIEHPGWIHQFGEVASCTVEDWGLVTSLRVYYADGSEVEFGMTSLEWPSPPIDDGTARVIANSMKVLYDPTGVLAQARNAVASTSAAAVA